MPSKKPRIATYTTEDNICKFRIIAAYNGKSMSEYMEYLIDKSICEYEREHGEIPVKGE